MRVRFERLIGMVLLATSSLAYGPSVFAEEGIANANETIPEVVDSAALQSAGDFFEQRTTEADARFIFGIGYDDDKLAKDAQRIEVIYQDLLEQQVSDGPVLRTPDLANPYSTSVLLIRQDGNREFNRDVLLEKQR